MSLPDDVKESIDHYVQDGVPTGDFLRAVLANDLMESFGRADVNNRDALFDICSYIYNFTPMACRGSYQKVDAWIERK